MELLQMPQHAPTMQIPKLITIPDLNMKENERPSMIPLLKVDLSNNHNNQYGGTKLFRLPNDYFKPQIMPIQAKSVQPSIPKLIDIRSVLNMQNRIEPKILAKPEQYKEIKLIKLPKVEQPTKLLSAPPKPKNDLVCHKLVEKEQPQLVDIRPFTPQETLNFIDPKIAIDRDKKKKTPKVVSRNVPAKKSAARSRRHKSPKKVIEDEESTENEEEHNKTKKHDKKENMEDQLYNIISDLLMERKKKKKKQKKLRLFDIIDSIPLTSESEEDNETPIITKHRKKNIETINNKPIIEQTNRSSALPNPPTPFLAFEPKPSKFITKNNEDAALSWANIIKAARQETQATQTDKINTNTNGISQEIQTEIKDMVEIPRTQTFFSKTNIETDQSVKKMNEFCEKVRKEVEEKLANLTVNEDKHCQTVCHAGMQTDIVLEEVEDSDFVKAAVPEKKKSSNVSASDQSHKPRLPPDIHTDVHFNQFETDSPKKKFINIVDFDSSRNVTTTVIQPPVDNVKNTLQEKHHSFKLESIDDFMTRIAEEKKKKKISKDEKEKEDDAIVLADEEIQGARNTPGFNVDENDNGYSISDVLNSISARSGDTKNRKKKHASSDKSKLHNNIDEFSVGLNALNDIHENIERELKQSKFLFGMIETIQDGFMSDGEVAARRPSSEESASVKDSENANVIESLQISVPIDVQDGGQDGSMGLQRDEKQVLGLIEEDRLYPQEDSRQELGQYSYDSLDQLGFSKQDDELLQRRPSPLLEEVPASNEFGRTKKISPGADFNEFGNTKKISPVSNEFGRMRKVSPPPPVSDDFGVTRKVQQLKSKVETEKDKLLKEEIKKRICKTRDKKESKEKQEEDKREKLMKWIKSRKMEQQKKYMEELEAKRGAEHRPFISKNAVAGKEIKQNTSFREQVKRAVLEEDNQDRLLMAERLASNVISKKASSTRGAGTVRIPHSNNRYQKMTANASSIQPKKIPIRETRSSRIRKTALVSDILKNQQVNQAIAKSKRKPVSAKNVKQGKENKNKSTKGQRSKSAKGAKKAKPSQNDQLSQSFALSDGRRSVEARDFVTRDSYDDYVIKSSLKLKQTIREYKDFDESAYFDDELGNDYRRPFTSSRLSNVPFPGDDPEHYENMFGDHRQSPSVQQRKLSSAASSIDNNQLKTLLKTYGMDVDGGMFEKASGTSQLLAEVDIALLDESDVTSEHTIQSEMIDWNEVDRILEE